MMQLKHWTDVFKSIGKAQWLAIAAAIGVLLVLNMSGSENKATTATDEEIRLARIIGQISGVRSASVMIAYDENERCCGAVVVAKGRNEIKTLLLIQRTVQTITGLELKQIEIVLSDD